MHFGRSYAEQGRVVGEDGERLRAQVMFEFGHSSHNSVTLYLADGVVLHLVRQHFVVIL